MGKQGNEQRIQSEAQLLLGALRKTHGAYSLAWAPWALTTEAAPHVSPQTPLHKLVSSLTQGAGVVIEGVAGVS